jgi:hypothetical protein
MRGLVEDASKLGIGAPRAGTIIAELRPDAGEAEAGVAEAQMEASKGCHDAEDPCAEGTRCWRWTRAVRSLQMQGLQAKEALGDKSVVWGFVHLQ